MSATVHRIELALVVIVEKDPHVPGFNYRIELEGIVLNASSASLAFNTEEGARKAAERIISELARYQIERAARRMNP
jgi:hypothetical protein